MVRIRKNMKEADIQKTLVVTCTYLGQRFTTDSRSRPAGHIIDCTRRYAS